LHRAVFTGQYFLGIFHGHNHPKQFHMDLFLILPILALALAAWGGHFISTKVYNNLKKNGNKGAVWFRVLVFLASFIIIGGALLALFIYNIRIER
jgi:hypothetical protein